METWSGIPYFVLRFGRDSGFLEQGLRLNPKRLRGHRALWNMIQLIRFGLAGGYQYTDEFAARIMRQVSLPSGAIEILSLFSLLPGPGWPLNWTVDFYIDATQRQVFEEYEAGRRVAKRLQDSAIARERENFERARNIFVMSQWAADSVVRDYGIDPKKVRIVPGGANLDELRLANLADSSLPLRPSATAPLRLGFLGKEWGRKGGDFVLQVAECIAARGIPAVVRAIGPDPTALPQHAHLEPVGFLHKERDLVRFVREVTSWHFGTLFSKAEAFGISNRECLRLGVPVLAAATGGIPATLPDSECGQLFALEEEPARVADYVCHVIEDYDAYLARRGRLRLRSDEFTWRRTIEELKGWVSM